MNLLSAVFLSVALQEAPPETIDDLKPGHCLTFQDMQRLGGVFSKDVYLAADNGACDQEHPVAGEIFDNLVCADPVLSGDWSRKVAEHPMWGVWWPSRPPCFVSVTEARVSNSVFTRLTSVEDSGQQPPACLPEDFVASQVQEESFVTKLWDVGEGQMYLPNPLMVRTESYLFDPEIGNTMTSCRLQQLKVSYKGWGSFESIWWRYTCDQEKPERCRVAKMKASETELGETCVLIRQINECSPAEFEAGNLVISQ